MAFGSLGFGKIAKISFGMFILLLQLFIFINTPVIFKDNVVYWNRVMLTYLVMLGVFFAVPNFRSNLFNIKLFQALPKYLIAFALTYGLFSIFKGFFVNATFASYISGLSGWALSIVVVHSLIISIVEESIFRGPLMDMLGIFWSSAIFAVFHWTVYGQNMGYIALMFVLGLLFAFIKKTLSPKDGIVNSAVHGAYNIAVYGI